MQLGSDDLFVFSEDRLCCQFYDKAASWSHWNPAIYYKGKIVVFFNFDSRETELKNNY